MTGRRTIALALLEPAPRPPLSPDGSWLVRPDGYVVAVDKPGETGCFEDFLDSL